MVDSGLATRLQDAIGRHQSGRLAEAEAMYREILARAPACVDALHYLGVIQHQVGRNQAAVELLSRAAALDPGQAAIHCNLGSALLQLARCEEAVSRFRRALVLQPDFPQALNNLGNALAGLGRFREAEASVRQAIARRPDFANAYNSLGNILREQGRTDEAVDALRRAVALAPGFADAFTNLGAALSAQGRFEEAGDSYRRALALQPESAIAHNHLGNTLRETGQLQAALQSFRRAIALRPDYAEAHNNLGILHFQLGEGGEAEACFRRAIALRPDFSAALNHLGCTLMTRGRLAEAIGAFRQAVAAQPDFPKAHNNLGMALARQGNLAEAADCYGRALAQQPGFAEAHNNLGILHREQGRLDDALASFDRALAARPDFAEALNNRAGVFKDGADLDAAIQDYRRALSIKPDYDEARSNLILAIHYRCGDEPARISEELGRWRVQHPVPPAGLADWRDRDWSPERRLRIGYVSPDFRAHPVGWFLLPLLAAHDRRASEIFCYSIASRPDHVTGQLRAYSDGWRLLDGQSDQEAAGLIRGDRIDILVDLALHTAGNRLGIFALRPAPVQATYLAYPGSSGLDAIDYRITDPHLDPVGSGDAPGAEQPVRLPETYWCYRPSIDPSPEVSPLPARDRGLITFGCLNNLCKVTPETLATWARLLVETPGARLCLHARPGQHRARLRRNFHELGVDPGRVEFLDHLPASRYFQAYHSIDIGLDPFPFPGGTTTCDALWMGVPVVSLAGPTPLSRGGLSLLTNVGLGELVARRTEDYIAIAAALARDVERLAGMRASLREQMRRSPLMDAPQFVRHLEAAYRAMWHRRCRLAATAG